MPIVTTRCVVLQVHRFSDTSKILRLMTREHGPRSAIARGALRPRSRIGGLLEPFAEGNATLYLKPNRDLHTLSAFELVRDRQALGRDLRRYAGASVLCELVLRLAPEYADESLFGALVEGLDSLLASAPEEVPGTALAMIWRLVEALGFAPMLDACLECGRPLEEGEGSFDVRAGGLLCGDCRPRARPLDAATLERLRSLAGREEARWEADATQTSILADFIRYHAAEGSPLRSLDFLTLGDG